MAENPEVESISWLRPATMPGAEFLSVRNCLREWHCFLERYAVCGCSIANSGWRYRNKDHFLGNRTTGFMEPGETQCNTRVHVAQDFVVLLIDPKLMSDAAYKCGMVSTPHFRLALTDEANIFMAVQRLRESVNSSVGVLEQQTRFSECVRLMLGFTEGGSGSTNNFDSGIVQRAKDYLQANFREAIPLDKLAAAASANRYHLVHAFTHQVGVPPHAYQTLIRIEKARAMLKMGVPYALVAAEMGFADQSHFTRKFREVMKVTPGRYVHAWQ